MSSQAFLGTGWAFPPRFVDNGAKVETVSGAEDVHQSLQILLGTARGERLMREDFGADLRAFQFEEIDRALINRMTAQISDAILYYEPRVELLSLNLNPSEQQEGLLLIELSYAVQGTNSRFNMVYPFYLNEGAAHG